MMRRARTTKYFSYVLVVISVAPSVRSTRAPVLVVASVLQAAKPSSILAPSIFLLPQSHPRREILTKVALRVARSQIKALFRPFYESCISEPTNSTARPMTTSAWPRTHVWRCHRSRGQVKCSWLNILIHALAVPRTHRGVATVYRQAREAPKLAAVA